jgi:SPX domain protein involved in polyphosphate accumulation
VTDDIVTRLREKYSGQLPICSEAANEIERLRAAIQKIEQAIVDEGKMPPYHRAVMKRHRMEWGTLHNAIDEAIKAIHNG